MIIFFLFNLLAYKLYSPVKRVGRFICLKMAFAIDDQTDGFSFIWTIQNFSYCLQKNTKILASPRFALNTNNPETFILGLFPRGSDNDDSFAVQFRKEDVTKELRIAYVLSIRTVRGSYKKIVDGTRTFSSSCLGFTYSVSHPKILQKGTDAYLDNDSLTIKCRIVKVDDKLLEFEQCYARTEVKVERAIFTWNLKTLGDLKTKELDTMKPVNLSDIFSFAMNASFAKGIPGEDKFEMIVKLEKAHKSYFSKCAISLLEAEKVLHSVQNEHMFEISNGEQIWTISFAPKSNLLINSSKQNSTIYLRCEFGVSSAVLHSTIEKTVYGIAVDRPLEFSEPTMDRNNISTWTDNLRCFYLEGKFSDLTIRTPSKKFPVHKAVLCAQSAVFESMFERDMKENRTGIVEIEDLEDDIVSRMLLFVYTSTVENLDWEVASKLYFAADKYEMTALKEKCSFSMKENLSTWNACKLLVLADMHQDQDLKSVAQDFVIEHSVDIISSGEWKTLMKDQLQLAAETMHVMCMRNLKV